MIPDWEHNCVFLADKLKDRHPSVFTRIQQILINHGIEVRLLANVRDVWTRDYSPVQVGQKFLVKFRYDPDYLRDEPRLRTGNGIVNSFGDIGRCRRSQIILDGGNIVASRTRVILTDKIYKENPGLNRSDLRDEIKKLLRVERLILIPREPYDPIGHADSMVRFLDEDTVLVNDYAEVDPPFGGRLVKALRSQGLATEPVPYFHERRSTGGIPSAVGCYANFLRTEKVVIVPAFGSQHDHVSLERLRNLMPKVPVVSLDATSLAREGGVFNCISSSYRRVPRSDKA